jgi:predicted site-specific integrase-resolvase
MSGHVGEIVVAHRDRLCRFGFELIQTIANRHNCRIVVLEESNLSPQEELVRDLLSIVHVFSCRLYGLRKYSNKIKEDKDLPKK